MKRWIINDASTYWVTQLKTSKNSADVSKGSYSTVQPLPGWRAPVEKKKEKAKVRRAIIGVIGTRARVNRISQIRFRSREYVSLGNGVSVDYGNNGRPTLLTVGQTQTWHTSKRIVALMETTSRRTAVPFLAQCHVHRTAWTSLTRGPRTWSFHSRLIEIRPIVSSSCSVMYDLRVAIKAVEDVESLNDRPHGHGSITTFDFRSQLFLFDMFLILRRSIAFPSIRCVLFQRFVNIPVRLLRADVKMFHL